MLKKLLVLLLFVVAFCTIKIASAEFRVKTNSETNQWIILENDKPVLQYNYGILPLPEGYFESLKGGKIYAVPRGDYLHPIYDLDGEPITKDWNSDHPHHRGMYWAWPEVGYKNELGDLHALQKVFARPTGNIETVTTKDGQLKLIAENVWKWQDKEPIVREQATFTIFPVDKNGRKINLEFCFEALVDEVTLARRGTKHYGGLNLRMLPLKEFKIDSFYGKEKDTPITEQPAWVCGSWNNPKKEGRTELTIFEKATNPDYPGSLIQFPNLNWFQPTFPKTGTRYTLKKGTPLILRYQLWLHNATDDNNAKKESWKNYQNEK
ncbi:MAG: PmoA family protein [Planctomycetaceae bacterium]|jgi:hypothetical protein|nr:PmoA family protein [Planctomycetaceae bacterium]